jgi:hypothetical protein
VMLNTRGQQFSADELETLLTTSGFVHVEVTHTYAYYSVVTARKPSTPAPQRVRPERSGFLKALQLPHGRGRNQLCGRDAPGDVHVHLRNEFGELTSEAAAPSSRTLKPASTIATH